MVAEHERLGQRNAGGAAAATAVAASAARRVNGFSHSTCLPASIAAIVHSTCSAFGAETYTASTAGSAIRPACPAWNAGMPWSRA